jgi:hypothetical protein
MKSATKQRLVTSIGCHLSPKHTLTKGAKGPRWLQTFGFWFDESMIICSTKFTSSAIYYQNFVVQAFWN